MPARKLQTRTLKNGKKSYPARHTWYDDNGRRPYRKFTFPRSEDRDNFIRQVAKDELEGTVTERPKRRGDLFQTFTEGWLKTRLVKGKPLAPSTVIGYQRLLRRNVYPHFGQMPLRRITSEGIRTRYSETTSAVGRDQAAKSYRLLHAILNTAAEEGVIPSRVNPCRIRGGGTENSRERPLVETSTVLKLADAIEATRPSSTWLGSAVCAPARASACADVTSIRPDGRYRWSSRPRSLPA